MLSFSQYLNPRGKQPQQQTVQPAPQQPMGFSFSSALNPRKLQGRSPLAANVPTPGFKFKRGDVKGNLLQLLHRAESPDYITMAGGDKNPELEKMTVSQIANRYGNRAVGRYQIQRDTALDVLRNAKLNPDTYVFDKKGQDRLYDLLLEQRGKLSQFQAGKISREQFAKNIARVWAGLPMDESGKSRYEESGNKAHVKWVDVLRALE